MRDRTGTDCASHERPLCVVVHNIRHGLADGHHAARPWDVEAAARRLSADVAGCCEADVTGFCEVDRRVLRTGFTDQPRLLAAGFGAMGSAFGAARRMGRWGTFGNLLVTRGELDDVEVVPLPGAIGRDHRKRGARHHDRARHLLPGGGGAPASPYSDSDRAVGVRAGTALPVRRSRGAPR